MQKIEQKDIYLYISIFAKIAFHLCPPIVPLISGDKFIFKIFVEWGTKFLLLGDKNKKSAAIPCGLVAPGVNK